MHWSIAEVTWATWSFSFFVTHMCSCSCHKNKPKTRVTREAVEAQSQSKEHTERSVALRCGCVLVVRAVVTVSARQVSSCFLATGKCAHQVCGRALSPPTLRTCSPGQSVGEVEERFETSEPRVCLRFFCVLMYIRYTAVRRTYA